MKLLYVTILFATLACIAGLNKGATLARENAGLTTRSDLQARTQNIYVANDSGQDIYVMATLNPDWALADFIVDIGLLVVSLGRIQAAFAAAAGLTINTPRDLFAAIQLAGQIIRGAASVGSHTVDAAQSLVDAFKNTSTLIVYKDYKDVYQEGFLQQYLSPDGIAGMLGAQTVTLMIMSGDGQQVAMWNTGPDNSWIATNNQQIVRSIYGTLWQQDPGAGTENWPVASSTAISTYTGTSSASQPTTTNAGAVMKVGAAWVGALAGLVVALM